VKPDREMTRDCSVTGAAALGDVSVEGNLGCANLPFFFLVDYRRKYLAREL